MMMRFKDVVDFVEFIRSKSKNLERVYHLSKFLKNVDDSDMHYVILFFQARVFDEFDERKLGISGQLVMKALNQVTGVSLKKIEDLFKQLGDLGTVAETLLKQSKQKSLLGIINSKQELTIRKVYENMYKIASLEGQGTIAKKLSYLVDLLINSSPIEAKYIVRLTLDTLRIGIGFGMLRDAVVYAFLPKIVGASNGAWKKCPKCNEIVPDYDYCVNCGNKVLTNFLPDVPYFEDVNVEEWTNYEYLKARNARDAIKKMIDLVESKYDLTNDLAKVALALKKGMPELLKIKLQLFKPVRAMLFVKVESIKDAFETVGKPAAMEYKYDGFRIQAHISKDGKVKLYTRSLEDVTRQFPELVNELKKLKHDAILDGEAIAVDEHGRAKPFQEISQRIRRKYHIEEMAKRYPVRYEIFDILFLDGKELLQERFKNRRKLLEDLIKPLISKHISLAKQIITDDEEKAKAFFKESIENGNEGLMIKALNAPYKPGKRVGYGVKLKTILDPLDLVIVEAEWGEGKRSNWLTSYTVACLNPINNELLTVGKVSTGVKEKDADLTYDLMTKLLKPLIVEEHGKVVKVRPEIIIEVGYEEIQKSPNYSSGFALRFPRVIRIRDKPLEEISTIDDVEKIYRLQRGRHQ